MTRKKNTMAENDPRYTTASIDPLTLRYLALVLKQRGQATAPLCRGLGFDAADLDEPSFRISYRQASLMISRAMAAVKDTGLGLAVGLKQTPISWGLVGFGMMSCATLGEAMNFGLRFQKDAGSLADITMQRARGQVSIVADLIFPDPAIEVFLVEEMFASMVNTARFLVGPQFAPTSIEVIYRAPPHADWYQPLFRCPVHFGKPRNRLWVALDAVAQPLATHDALVAKSALEMIEKGLQSRRESADFGATVERAIRAKLEDPPGVADIAATMHLSERTLRRKLNAAGFSYQNLIDSVRKSRALELLSHSETSVAQVGTEIGFADVRAFRKAFKRWTGLTPNEFRFKT